MQRLPAITHERFSLFRFRSPLLTESRLFSLPAGNEMFHFPAFPPHALCVQAWVTGHDSCRVSPFGHPRITARLAAPRGFSQPPTTFFGSWCLGIHRAPLLTWPQRCSRPLCSSQVTDVPVPPTRVRGSVRVKKQMPAPSGLNSVPGSRLLLPAFPAPEGAVLIATTGHEAEWSASTHELPPRDVRSSVALDRVSPVRCSLERR